MEDPENLVRIYGTKRQVIVGVAPVIEMEAADHFCMQQPRHDLLDILRLIVMSGIHQHERLWPGVLGQQNSHAPVGDVSVIEGWLERFIFDQQALTGLERCVDFAQPFLKKANTLSNVLSAGIVRTVGKPG